MWFVAVDDKRATPLVSYDDVIRGGGASVVTNSWCWVEYWLEQNVCQWRAGDNLRHWP